MEKTLETGMVYYIPEKHKLTQVRRINDNSIKHGGFCKYFNDSKTVTSIQRTLFSKTNSWEPVSDPANHKCLEHDSIGWRVINDELVNVNDVQKHLSYFADKLKEKSEVIDVFVFGSIARNGTGNDVDIICTVPDSTFLFWRKLLLESLEYIKVNSEETINKSFYFNSSLRRYCAEEVLEGLPESAFVFQNTRGTKGFPIENVFMPIDIFLFPTDWRDRLEELQKMLPHEDPHFMEKIAIDAKLL